MTIETADGWVLNAVGWLRLLIEATGATLVGIGFLVAVVGLLRSLFTGGGANFTAVRLTLAKYLALALEFQLGADILSTAIAPSWEQIGKLAAIAVIRTGLNYFLSVEMRAEEATPPSKSPPKDRPGEPAPGRPASEFPPPP